MTSGDLGVHPGLKNAATAANVRAEMKALLSDTSRLRG